MASDSEFACCHAASSLLVRAWFKAGLGLVPCCLKIGPRGVQVQCWSLVGSMLIHCWFNLGSWLACCEVLCRFAAGQKVVHG